MYRYKITLLAAGVIFFLLSVGLVKRINSHLLPETINKQLEFSALVPSGKPADFSLVKESFKYDTKEKILSFTLKKPDNQLVFTEQAYPEILIYDKFVAALNPTAELQTKSGKVTLIKPKELAAKEAAVLNYSNQVLLFAKPDKDLTENQWRQFFNSLEVVK